MSIHCPQQKSMVDSDMLESESCTVSVGGGSPGDGGGGTTTERERGDPGRRRLLARKIK